MPSKLHVITDATTGEVLSTRDEVVDGTGNSWISGPVTINTTLSGSTFSLRDPNHTNTSCSTYSPRTIFTGPDDVWGNSNGTSIETGCVDALYGVEREMDM